MGSTQTGPVTSTSGLEAVLPLCSSHRLFMSAPGGVFSVRKEEGIAKESNVEAR